MSTLPDRSNNSDIERVWLRITAFLSLKAPGTRVTYTGIIHEWCRFLGAEPGTPKAAALIVQATDLHAIAYRKFLETQPGERSRLASATNRERAVIVDNPRRRSKKEGLDSTQSNATIHKKFAALRRIYRVLVASNVGIRENPFEADKVPPPPKDAGRKRPTEMIDFALVMEVIESPKLDTPKGVRDSAILAVLFGGGLRRSELVSLRVGDVRRTPAGTTFLYLRHTKARRDAEQALPAWAAEKLWNLVAQRKTEGAAEADYVFVGYTGRAGMKATHKQMSDTGVYLLFKQYCMAAGAGVFVTPHSARATAITKLLSDGVSHREVQEFSRHSSIQMVEWYDKRRFDIEKNPAKDLGYEVRKKK